MPLKFVATADLHLGSEIPGLDRFGIIKQIFRFAVDKEVDFLIVVGDIYHHLMVSNEIRTKFNRWIKKLSEDVRVILIPGNHDIGNKTTSLAPIVPLVPKNLTIINEPSVIKIKGNRLLLLPYDRKWDKNPKQCIKTIRKQRGEYDFVFGHFAVDGATVGPSNFSMSNAVSGDTLEKYLQAKYIILGHIHKPQKSGNIYYCGSPDYLDFGERNEKKRFLFVSRKGIKSKILENKKLLQLEVGFDRVDGKIHDDAIYKIVVKCSKEQVGQIDLKPLISQIKGTGGRIVKISWDLSITARRRAKHIDFRKSIKQNIKKYVEAFAEERERSGIFKELNRIWPEVELDI